MWCALQATRKKTKISGEVLLKLELFDSASSSLSAETLTLKWNSWLSAILGTPMEDIQDPMNKSSDSVEQDDDDDDDEDDDDESSDEVAESTDPVGSKKDSKAERKKKRRGLPRRKRIHKPFELIGGSDVVGVVFLEVNSITDLPPERNSEHQELFPEFIY